MKIVKTILVVVLVVVSVTFQSCSANDNEETPSSSDLFIKFTLNNQETDIQGEARVISAFSGNNFKQLSINANNNLQLSDPDYVSITLLIPNKDVSPGTYNFSGDVFTSGLYHCRLRVDGATIQSLNTGSLVVTSNTGGIIEGTFSGAATIGSETYTVTNGSFRAISDDN
ncbi:hypothetical protein JL193_07170 [Polaribacter batillariae]|uniref:DUF4382 domain-containing protein n=1 Tax=Polaribacter batillariae TaxID=2808900 RepID=A0ABX7SXN4_9FLAO|nr:hypothetical protein [Polaribacter batillariae]QTD39022.1 hypothetical protein JL193_07170 [Polaribacter batillariae]